VLADLLMTNEERIHVPVGADPYGAVVEAVCFYESMGCRPVRLDADDSVTLAEAGLRAGCSRERMRLWSVGQHGPGSFPPPLNPDRDTSFYSWYEISEWLRSNDRAEAGDVEEPVLIALNLAIQLRRLLPRLTRPEVVLALVSPTVERPERVGRGLELVAR
jgi:hypothetical protein